MTNIILPGRWVGPEELDDSIHEAGDPLGLHHDKINIRVPVRTNILIQSALRLLSLCNQLIYRGTPVEIHFDAVQGAMSYLDRMGFFDYLHPNVDVHPTRPKNSAARIFAGNSTKLVEITNINPNKRPGELPGRLADTLEQAVKNLPHHKRLANAAFTVFSELIDNIYEHSSTEIDGYAALQVYPRGNKASVAVSDSGQGIINTLRPSLPTEFPHLVDSTDTDLVVEAFKSGLSRHGQGRGCGLKISADQSIKYSAQLDIRLPNSRVHLVPASIKGGASVHTAYCTDDLPLLWGTHINFDFMLDEME